MDKVQECVNKLDWFVAISMELQEEYSTNPQDFARREELQKEYSDLRIEILTGMLMMTGDTVV